MRSAVGKDASEAVKHGCRDEVGCAGPANIFDCRACSCAISAPSYAVFGNTNNPIPQSGEVDNVSNRKNGCRYMASQSYHA